MQRIFTNRFCLYFCRKWDNLAVIVSEFPLILVKALCLKAPVTGFDCTSNGNIVASHRFICVHNTCQILVIFAIFKKNTFIHLDIEKQCGKITLPETETILLTYIGDIFLLSHYCYYLKPPEHKFTGYAQSCGR